LATAQLAGSTAIVTGASRGFGRGVAAAFVQAGAQVVGIARDPAALDGVAEQLGSAFTPVVADVADPVVAGTLIDRYRPRVLVLNAGAAPLPRPVQRHTWQTFSRNWEVDVQHAFHWTREALLLPLESGSTVVAVSSAAALRGSPLSGGYAGAKAAIRFLTSYAAAESRREGLGVRFVAVLPQLSPATRLGEAGAAAYAAREGVDVATFLENLGLVLTPEQVGTDVVDLVGGTDRDADAYLLTAAGLNPVQ
jgi:NAD(P)-dependent dehydrogenase (short-subunit alcohol dehydrogenase family)